MGTWKGRVVFVYGGTFDPIHEGHLDVIEKCVASGKQLVVAPAVRNPWKSWAPANIAHRQTMIEMAVRAAGLSISRYLGKAQVMLAENEYELTHEFVQFWDKFHGTKIVWIVGTDGLDRVTNWKNFPELDIAIYPWFITHHFHATDVREGRIPPLPAIRDYIKQHHLYPNALSG